MCFKAPMTCTHAYVGFHTISKIRIRVRSSCDMGSPGLPVGENRVILDSLVLTQYKRVTDRRTRRLQLSRAVA